MNDFTFTYGPVALVTRASSGIGAGFAEQLASRGLDLIVVARREERLTQLRARLGRDYGVQVTPIRYDLTSPMPRWISSRRQPTSTSCLW